MRGLLRFSALIVFAVAGCGVYTLNPAGKSDIQTIAIMPFENQTSQYELTDRLTEIVIDAFIADGKIKVVGEANADALMYGSLNRYQRIPHEFDENDQVQQYKVVMSFEVSLKKPQTDSDIWTERFNVEGIYDAVDQTEEDGQVLAGAQLVRSVLDKSTKSW